MFNESRSACGRVDSCEFPISSPATAPHRVCYCWSTDRMNVKLTNLWRAYPGGARVNNIILKIDIKLFVFYSPVTLNIKSNVPKKKTLKEVYTLKT